MFGALYREEHVKFNYKSWFCFFQRDLTRELI